MSTTALESQVSGRVWKLVCHSGQEVSEGELVIVVESMKMEIPHESPASGTVRLVVAEGDTVTEGQVLATVS